MKRTLGWGVPLFVVSLAVALLFQGDAVTSEGALTAPVAVSTPTAGMTVGLDPVTGEFMENVPPPIPDRVLKDPTGPYSTSHEGLQEVAAPVGGGQMVDLQGRFQQAYTASVSEDKKLTAGCGLHQSAEAHDASQDEGE